jgi:hypothetical protein
MLLLAALHMRPEPPKVKTFPVMAHAVSNLPN